MARLFSNVHCILGISVPSFVIASLLQLLFTVHWNILPTTGWGEFKHTILPTIALSFSSIATYAKIYES